MHKFFGLFLSFSPFTSRRRRRIARFEKNSILFNNNNVRQSLPQNYDFNPVTEESNVIQWKVNVQCATYENKFYSSFICLNFYPVSLNLSAIIHDSCSETHITRNKCTLIGPIDSTELNLQVTKVTLKEIFGRERKCENLPCCRCEKMKKNQPQFIGG